MRAIVNSGPNRLELKDLPLPEPKAGQVRIRTAACGICATDLHMISGWDRITYPAIPGHEWAGIVDDIGDGVDTGWLGRCCVGENVLSDGGEVGFEHPGGYAECFVTEAEKLRFLPDGFSLTEATLIEPLAVCLRAMQRLRLDDRSAAIIFGDGPIGLLMAALLYKNKVEYVVLVGGRDTRLKLAREIGADETINYHQSGDRLVDDALATIPSGFPNVVEASGAQSALQDCLNVAGKKGKVLVIGEYGQARFNFPANQLLLNELELIGSNASEEAWDEAVSLAMEGDVPLRKLITHEIPAWEYGKAMEIARNWRDAIKVVLKWANDHVSS